MATLGPGILTINGGSSSIKFAWFGAQRALPLRFRGQITGIGSASMQFDVGDDKPGSRTSRGLGALHSASPQAEAVTALTGWIDEQALQREALVVGHRLVHGGATLHQPQVVTPELLAQLRQLIPLDRSHLPLAIQLIEAIRDRFPKLPQMVCFDTAFHHSLPRVAQLLSLPRRYSLQGLRRYGFHGLSYEFLTGELRHLARNLNGHPTTACGGRAILLHLGNGASLAAVRDGKPMDTSMGFTPTGGMPMGTRAGDLDPGIVSYLLRTERLKERQFEELVTAQSGLFGISESSGDLRELLLIERHDVRAAEAIAFYCYQVKKWIGAYAAALGGLDTLVFTGGVGENLPRIRARICLGLEFLGIRLNASKNLANADLICADGTSVQVRVIRTNEELVIARTAWRLLNSHRKPPHRNLKPCP